MRLKMLHEGPLLVGLFLLGVFGGFFEKLGVSSEAVFVGNRVFKNWILEGHQSEERVSTKEDKSTGASEISAEKIYIWSFDDFIKDKLTQNDRKIKSGDINKKNWFFGNKFVAVKDDRNDDNQGEKGSELGEEIVGVGAINVAIY